MIHWYHHAFCTRFAKVMCSYLYRELLAVTLVVEAAALAEAVVVEDHMVVEDHTVVEEADVVVEEDMTRVDTVVEEAMVVEAAMVVAAVVEAVEDTVVEDTKLSPLQQCPFRAVCGQVSTKLCGCFSA